LFILAGALLVLSVMGFLIREADVTQATEKQKAFELRSYQEQVHDLIHERDQLAAQAGRFKRERDELARQNQAIMESLDRIEKVIVGRPAK